MRAKLAVRGTSKEPFIGLFRERTHEVVEIPDCRAHHPSINQAVLLIREAMIQQGIAPYDEVRKSGQLRYVQLFVCRKTHRVQLTLVANKRKSLESLAAHLAKMPLWHSIWINIQSEETNRILGQEWLHFSGEPFLWQPMGRANLAFHPGAFAQAHLSLFDQLLYCIETWVPLNARLLEIYAGAGGIALHLASRLQSAILVEENPYASLSFQKSVQTTSIRYIQKQAIAALSHLEEVDLILVDPPRKGIDPILLDALKKTGGKQLIYISCWFESFQRDAEALLEAGWSLIDAAGFWLFPGTNQVELATKWQKNK